MSSEKAEEITKQVDFAAKDDAQQIATGVVMVPYAVDLQGDWERPETIEQFAEQFADFEEVGQADGGVMHAAWPSEHISLEENRVLDEGDTIGGRDVPAGAWVQSWKFEDEELWGLVDDAVLEGYSIGAINVHWDGPIDQDDLPDEVDVPDDLPEEEPVWELTDGIIREVSAVDIPAVPDAEILSTKADADAEKRLADHLGNRDGFIAEAQERGHSEEDAERLWEYLNRAIDVEGAGEPGTKSRLAAAGKAFLDTLTGSGSGSDDGTQAVATSEAPDRDADPDSGSESAKEGQTLSRKNRESLYAAVDSNLDILEDAGVDHGMTRFTDREDTTFDLTEHSAREWADDEDEEEEEEDPDEGEEEEDAAPRNNAAGGDTPDDDGSDHEAGADTDDPDATDMSDTTDPDDAMAEAPEWAKTLHEDIKTNSERLDEQADQIEAALDDEEEKTVEIEVGGELYEVSESEAKAWFDEDSDPFDDAPAWAKALKERVVANSERVDTISRQSGHSQQLEAAAGDDDDEDTEKGALGGLGEALS